MRFRLCVLLLLPASAFAWTNVFNYRAPLAYNTYYEYGYSGRTVSAAGISNSAWSLKTNAPPGGVSLFDAGYRQFQIDGYWSTNGLTNALGVPQPDPARFPNGMAPVVDFLHGLGFTVSIYFAGDIQQPDYPDGIGPYKTNAVNWAAEMGFDDIDFDFINQFVWPPGSGIFMYPQDQVAHMASAIAASSRPQMTLQIVQFPFKAWHPWYANNSRTSPDDDGTFATFLENLDDYIDNDVLYLTNGIWSCIAAIQAERPGSTMTTNEIKSQFQLLAITGSHLRYAKSTNITAPTLEVLANPYLISINQDGGLYPGTRKTRTAGWSGNMEAWSRTLTNSYTAVAAFNGTAGTTNVVFTFSEVGLAETSANVWRIGMHPQSITLVGAYSNGFTATNLLTHETVTYVLQPLEQQTFGLSGTSTITGNGGLR